MTFRVEPEAIRAYALQLREAAHVADTATLYLRRHSNVGAHGTGLLAQAMGSHAELVGALDRMLVHLTRLTDASEVTLHQIADQYDHTDKAAAATIDASYPEVTRRADTGK